MTEAHEDPLAPYEGRINYQLHRYGLGDDPLAKGRARVLASKAIKTYDPNAGASMHTWLDRSLQPLSRFKRERSFAVQLPERAVLDNFEVRRAEIEFEEAHGRPPDMDELSDAAGIPRKRLAALRRTVMPQVGEAAFDGEAPLGAHHDYMDEALSSVWDDSDAVDRKILEMKTGFGGRYKPMSAEQVAAQLNISPVQVSRKSARLAAKIDEIMELMES